MTTLPTTRVLRTRTLAKQTARDTLDSLSRTAWFPLSYDASRASDKPTYDEWELARFDAEEHAQVDPVWSLTWPRPSVETSETVWSLMGYGPDDWMRLCGPFPRVENLTAGERAELAARTKQALCVAVHCALQVARQRRLFTQHDVWDALARCWSPTFRHVLDTTHTRHFYQILPATFFAVRHDLQMAQVSFEKLWRIVTGQTEVLLPYRLARHPKSGRTISTEPSAHDEHRTLRRKLLKALEAVLNADACMTLDEGPVRLLLATDRDVHPIPHYPLLPAITRSTVWGERASNITTANARGVDMLHAQSRAITLLDADTFLSDWRKARRRAGRIEHLLVRDYALSPSELQRLLSVRPIKYTGGQLRDLAREHKGAHGGTLKQAARTMAAALGEEVAHWDVHTTEREAMMSKLCQARFADAPAHRAQQERDTLLTRLDEWDRAHWISTQFEGVARRIKSLKRPAHLPKGRGWYLPCVSDFTRIVNGRWQAMHFGPAVVSTKPKYSEWGEDGEQTGQTEAAVAGLRLRWFKAPAVREWWRPTVAEAGVQDLVGLDVSSSQVQIIALLTNNAALYAAACDSTDPNQPGFKHTLAAAAWAHVVQGEHGYSGVEDERLLDMVKTFLMRFIYGSKPHRIISDHARERATYGPGFAGTTLRERMASAQAFLHAVPGGKDLEHFLAICQRMAETAMERDPYAGLSWHNPYDDAVVHHNPPALENVRVTYGNGGVLELQQPAGAPAVLVREHSGVNVGDYPVSARLLKQMTAPCFVHMLDGLFSALVIEALLRRGITCFSAIHDCWMIPATVLIGGQSFDGREVLRQAVAEAIREWQHHLGTVYGDMLGHVAPDDYDDVQYWVVKWLHGQGVLDPALADLPRHPFWQTWPHVRAKETPERPQA